jgi:DNA-binding FrmR family transcriptional regulator
MKIKAEIHEEVINRLKRIEGQVRGIQRLVEQGADCKKVASQVKAARTALDAAGKLVLACYLSESLERTDMNEREAIDLIVRF